MGEQIPIVIDPMRVRDIPDVLKTEELPFTTPWTRGGFWSELLVNDYAYYIVAKVNSVTVAYIGVWIIVDEGHITNVAVHPDYRRRGIGRRLLLAADELVRARGGRRMTLEVRKSNVMAQRLYRSLGYVPAGIRKGYYRDNREDAIVMWKELTDEQANGDTAPNGSYRDETE